MKAQYDVIEMPAEKIIIGAGVACCMVARNLSNQTEAQVYVIEVGSNYPALAMYCNLQAFSLKLPISLRGSQLEVFTRVIPTIRMNTLKSPKMY